MTDVPLPSESFAETFCRQFLLPFGNVSPVSATFEQKVAETGDTLPGLNGWGLLTQDALSVLGVNDYLELKVVENSGRVVKKASELLLLAAHSKEARDQVRKAHCELEQAVYFRQLDVMNHRFSTTGLGDGKTQRQKYKKALLTRSKDEILKEYDGDCRDRMLIREGKLAEIPREQQAPSQNVVGHDKGYDEQLINDKYRRLLQVPALQQASGTKINFLDPKPPKQKLKHNLKIEGTPQQREVAWKLITRQMELDSDCVKPAGCRCKYCDRARHFLQLDKVFEAKEKLHALLLCQMCSDKDTAEGPGKFDTASDKKFYCEKCWEAPVEEVGAVPQEANETCSLAT
jgi:hypothetical protein